MPNDAGDAAASSGRPEKPKVRALKPRWVLHQAKPHLCLEAGYGLSERQVLVPEALVPLLELCDGTRDAAQLRTALSLRTGTDFTHSEVTELIAVLDNALLLENGAFAGAAKRAVSEYRELPHRPLYHSDAVYPAEPEAFAASIRAHGARVDAPTSEPTGAGRLVGVVSPHIDYARGGPTYAGLWEEAKPHLDDVDLVLMFGTDHSGGDGTLTLTRQSYATPLGLLPTDLRIVDGLAEAVGADWAYAEELHHLGEHSIELAAAWLHYYLKGRPCPMVPILCGSFHRFVNGAGDPAADPQFDAALHFLASATAGRRTLAVAAGDLAHVGPEFGDPAPVDARSREELRRRDSQSISAICRGNAADFLRLSTEEADSRKLCGLPPIYMMLRYLDSVRGEETGYDQCPADARSESFVSIAGVLLYNDGD